MAKNWYLYLIRCGNGHLYAGITVDVERRFLEHLEGRGAKYLRGKGPLELVFVCEVGDRQQAARAEYRVKALTKTQKEEMIQNGKLFQDMMRRVDTAP